MRISARSKHLRKLLPVNCSGSFTRHGFRRFSGFAHTRNRPHEHLRLHQPAGVYTVKNMDLEDDNGVDQPENSGLFTRTHWSVVLRAKDESTTAMDTLFTKYRSPMIAYVVKRGFAPDRAEDAVQDFCGHLLDPNKKHFLANVDPNKGRFRTFLLNSLRNFISDRIRHEKTKKQGGGKAPDSLDETDSEGEVLHSPKSSGLSADLEFDRAWAKTIVQNSLRGLEAIYTRRGKAKFYQAVEPVIHGDPTSESYRKIAVRFGMTEGAVKVAIHEMRKLLLKLIRGEIKQTVKDKDELKDEFAYLINLLSPATP